MWGIASHFIVKKIMLRVWGKTTASYKEMYPKRKVPPELDSKKRLSFKWAPATIGILERIFYTTAIVFNQNLLIGVWVAFKIIGEWSDFSSKRNPNEGITRIRANNFLIGSALSLIFGIIGGVLFWLVINQNFIADRIQYSYH